MKRTLSDKLGRFLSLRVPYRQPMHDVLDCVTKHQTSAFFFGGLLRDIMLKGPTATPRDVDIVVHEMTASFLHSVECKIRRRTRFGGVNLESEGWIFDIWDLPNTWAFKSGIKNGCSFYDLPKTTFLNIQAVVAEVFPRPGKARAVYSHGFFEALQTRTLDINCEENPYPSLCVLQSLFAAQKLGFGLSKRLSCYIVHHTQCEGIEKLVHMQESHYGRAAASADLLHEWVRAITDQLRIASHETVFLPRTIGPQLVLPLASSCEFCETHTRGNTTSSRFASRRLAPLSQRRPSDARIADASESLLFE